MFGTKLRTWMETHIVRSRKKQNRNKEDKKSGNCSKSGSSPCHVESNSFERQYGKASPKRHGSEGVVEVQASAVGLPSTTSMSLLKNSTFRSAVNNLSSPESAYSTGYSTDGTSPGASIPPEYYINIRTGTHYFHSKPTNSSNTSALPVPQDFKASYKFSSKVLSGDTTCKVGSINQPPVSIVVLSPRPGRHKREDGTKKKIRQNEEQLPESSTEEDIADRLGKVGHSSPPPMLTPKVKNKLIHPVFNNLHRRTESYDESQQRSSGQSHERDSGDSLTTSTSNGYQCTSPYLPGASPRQRNRIRTNPWLNTNLVVNGPVPLLPGSKSYNSQGETSSTVGSSSTLSSTSCKPNSDENTPECMSPRSRERRRLLKDHSQDMKNCNSLQNHSTLFCPVSDRKKHKNSITTCSPKQNRLCHHSLRPKSPASSSSGSSSPSPASEDEHHGNTSDFSDDDVTLNEMLGKFDESYVYEKETDILSDSDPTDCEEQTAEEERTGNINFPENERQEDFDFIDKGSLVELVHSDSEPFNKTQLAGHCTYHHVSENTPEITRKISAKQRESFIWRRSRNNSQDKIFHRCSRNRGNESLKNVDSPPLLASNKKFSTYKKSSSQSLELQSSNEAIPHNSISAQRQTRRNTRVDSNTHQLGETPGKYMNLNRVLMERLITNQRNGTRSADGTPVTLRKRSNPSMYNGKYIKNHYVTNLISSDANFNDRRNSTEESLDYPDLQTKQRSHSISGHCSQVVNMSSTFGCVGISFNDLDKEGDMKYRKLIEEAENIIEDLQVKSKPDYLSPTFRCKNGMERAKPSSPLVFSVPPSPLSLRYDVCRDGYETPPRELFSNNSSLYEQSTYSQLPAQKEKNFDNEDGLLKTISKTLEKIIIRGTSDTNKKLDKSVSDPFAKGKRTFVLPSTEIIYSNINPKGCGEQQNRSRTEFATPNLQRRSSTGNSSSKLTPFSGATKLNQNEISSQSSFRKIFRRPDKSKTTSVDVHFDKHNYPENGFCLNSGLTNLPKEHIYENILNQDTKNSNHEVNNVKFVEKRGPLIDYSPNGNTPTYVNGFQQIPWQHRTSQAERLKHLSDLQQQSPKHKIDSSEIIFEETSPLVGFKSFDLGNKNIVGSGYCPQSEPVKRKVYTCSATFEKLQKTLLGKQTEVHPSNEKIIDTESADNLVLRGRLVPIIKENVHEESKECETNEHINRIVLASDKVETG